MSTSEIYYLKTINWLHSQKVFSLLGRMGVNFEVDPVYGDHYIVAPEGHRNRVIAKAAVRKLLKDEEVLKYQARITEDLCEMMDKLDEEQGIGG